MTPAPPLRWDVLEEHLDEAAFLHAQWERALRGPEYVLAEVVEGPEERLLAHLDGLVVGGRAAAERLLLPALEADEPDVAFAAAWALLASEDGDFTGAVVAALGKAEPELAASIGRALMLAPRADVFGPLAPLLASGPPPAQAAALEVLAFRRRDPGANLAPLLRAQDASVRRAALRLARHVPARVHPQALELAVGAEEPEERNLAIAAGLVLGSRAAWEACEAAARDGGPGWAFPALAWALSGAPDLAPLLAGLEDEARRADAIFALGFTGRVAAVDAVAPWLEDEALARLAGEAVSAVTGLVLESEFAAEPKRWDPDAEEDDEEDEPAGPEADLPAPEGQVVQAWWEHARTTLDPAARYLGGKPWSAEALVAALREGPMRRREALAFDLAVRTRGAVQLEPFAWAREQGEELTSLAAPALRAANATYERILQTPAARPAPVSPAPAAPPARASRPPEDGLVVTALGMITANGDGAAQACAAARAGLVRIADLDGFEAWDEDAGGMVPIAGHAVPHVAGGFLGAARLGRLGAAALRELLPAMAALDPARTALLVAGPSGAALEAFERAGMEAEDPDDEAPAEPPSVFRKKQLEQRLLTILSDAAGLAIPRANQRRYLGDGPGFAAALRDAELGIARGTWDACVVGGVDTLVEPAVLDALAGLHVLRTPARAQGLVPGEGAAFVLLERAASARRRGATARARLGRAVSGAAPSRFAPVEGPGVALAAAVRASLPGVTPPAIVLTSLNGDERRALEWGHALVRLQADGLPGETPEWNPAEWFGDLGAATGPAALCMAVRSWERRAWAGPAVAWLWGDGGAVGAFGVQGV